MKKPANLSIYLYRIKTKLFEYEVLVGEKKTFSSTLLGLVTETLNLFIDISEIIFNFGFY